jgi:crotonobetainyl-CoA:carnitine CoA-transferase CaiB-like acyl-CoA transferase
VKLVEWMASEGSAPLWLQKMDWATFELQSSQEIDRFLAPFAEFFLNRDRAVLLEAALKRGFMLAPVNSMAEVLQDPQLEARGAWADVAVDGVVVRLPRAPVQIAGVRWSPQQERSDLSRHNERHPSNSNGARPVRCE